MDHIEGLGQQRRIVRVPRIDRQRPVLPRPSFPKQARSFPQVYLYTMLDGQHRSKPTHRRPLIIGRTSPLARTGPEPRRPMQEFDVRLYLVPPLTARPTTLRSQEIAVPHQQLGINRSRMCHHPRIGIEDIEKIRQDTDSTIP